MNAHAAAIEAFINETTRCFGAPPVEVLLRQRGVTMDYDNRNRGSLFRNDHKRPDDDKDRDYSGSINGGYGILAIGLDQNLEERPQVPEFVGQAEEAGQAARDQQAARG